MIARSSRRLFASLSALAALLILSGCGEEGETTETDTGVVDDTSVAEDTGSTDATTDTAVDEDTNEADTDEVEDDTTVPEGCTYPDFSGNLGFEEIMPDFRWEDAVELGEPSELDLHEFYCDDEIWGDYTSLIVVMTAVWCTACPTQIGLVDDDFEELRDLGALVLYIDGQDNNGNSASTAETDAHYETIVPGRPGIRVGDEATLPEANAIVNSPMIEGFPTVFVVRRRDMQIITTSNLSDYYLPLTDIAADPEADWSSPEPVFNAECTADDEEEYEDVNDEAATAPTIGAGTIEGGICSPEPDFYFVDIEGEWTVDLEFTHRTGDLDVYVWDVDAGDVLMDGDRPVGSDSTTDNESFSHADPAMIMVYGYSMSSAPYTLTISTP